MNRFKNILFVADQPGTQSESFHSALKLAKANNASLSIMDVVEPMVWSAENQARFGTDLSVILRDRRLDELNEMTSPHVDDEHMIRTHVGIGTHFLEVIRATIRNKFDLVIKTAEKTQGFSTSTLGPNDQHLVRKCPCPVWIDREETTHPYKKILAAVDPIGDTDKGMARMILDLAFSIQPDAEVHIANAWRMPGEESLRIGRARLPYQQFEDMLNDHKKRHEDAMNELLQHYGLSTSDPNVHFEKNRATPLIADLAKRLPADLVVTGTVGRTGIPGFFIGNTAESLMHILEMPVMTVKPKSFVSPVTLIDD